VPLVVLDQCLFRIRGTPVEYDQWHPLQTIENCSSHTNRPRKNDATHARRRETPGIRTHGAAHFRHFLQSRKKCPIRRECMLDWSMRRVRGRWIERAARPGVLANREREQARRARPSARRALVENQDAGCDGDRRLGPLSHVRMRLSEGSPFAEINLSAFFFVVIGFHPLTHRSLRLDWIAIVPKGQSRLLQSNTFRPYLFTNLKTRRACLPILGRMHRSV
jgi:hypothetical protein